MRVAAELLHRGFALAKPIGDSLRYDLIVDLGPLFRRVQVKTARVRNGVVQFSTQTVNYVHGALKMRGYLGLADDFIAYEPEISSFYGIAVDDAPAGCAYLRIAPTANNQVHGIRKAVDYTLDNLCTAWLRIAEQGDDLGIRNRAARQIPLWGH